jgi:hypothetical protein
MSGTTVEDATSGFRAFSREAALRINVFNRHTYTLETLIQTGQTGFGITSVPIRVNPPIRPSKLVQSHRGYVFRSALTLIRMFVIYRPMLFFASLGVTTFGVGFIVGLRFLGYYLAGQGDGMVQSVVLSALLMGSGLTLAVVAAVADLIAINRRLIEDVQRRVRQLDSRPR